MEFTIEGSATFGTDYYLAYNLDGSSTILIDSNKNGSITISVGGGNNSVRVYVVPIEDSIFETDETVTMILTRAYTSSSEIEIGNDSGSVTILQAPEFISDVDTALGITMGNYQQKIPFSINADTYTGYADRNAQIGTEIVTTTPIFAAANRNVKYSFVLGDNTNYTIGQTLYYTPSGGWSLNATDNSVQNLPMFTIDENTGKIKTAADFKLLTHLPDTLPTFTIQAADSIHTKLYDRADVTVGLLTFEICMNTDNLDGTSITSEPTMPKRTVREKLYKNHKYGLGIIMLCGDPLATTVEPTRYYPLVLDYTQTRWVVFILVWDSSLYYLIKLLRIAQNRMNLRNSKKNMYGVMVLGSTPIFPMP